MRVRGAVLASIALLVATAGPVPARADGARTGWAPRADAARRAEVERILTEVFTLEQLAQGKARDAILTLLDRPPKEIEAAAEEPPEELDPELLDPEVRAEVRRDALERAALDELALVDVIAGAELPRVLVPLAYEALASLGADRERKRLLEVVDALGAEAPAVLLERLGTLGEGAPVVERRLIELVERAPRGSPTLPTVYRALERCAGVETLEALDLVATLARGDLEPALWSYDVLRSVAARDGRLVAERIVRQLKAPPPRGGCDEARRAYLLRVLAVAADEVALPHLLNWLDRTLVEAATSGAAEPSLPAAFPDALRALAATGHEDAIQRLLRLDAEAEEASMRVTVIRALAHVPAERAWDVLVWELVERLRASEAAGAEGAPVRAALVDALRQVTATRLGGDATTWYEFLRREQARRKAEAGEQE